MWLSNLEATKPDAASARHSAGLFVSDVYTGWSSGTGVRLDRGDLS